MTIKRRYNLHQDLSHFKAGEIFSSIIKVDAEWEIPAEQRYTALKEAATRIKTAKELDLVFNRNAYNGLTSKQIAEIINTADAFAPEAARKDSSTRTLKLNPKSDSLFERNFATAIRLVQTNADPKKPLEGRDEIDEKATLAFAKTNKIKAPELIEIEILARPTMIKTQDQKVYATVASSDEFKMAYENLYVYSQNYYTEQRAKKTEKAEEQTSDIPRAKIVKAEPPTIYLDEARRILNDGDRNDREALRLVAKFAEAQLGEKITFKGGKNSISGNAQKMLEAIGADSSIEEIKFALKNAGASITSESKSNIPQGRLTKAAEQTK